jgi:hypothetical protein
MKNNLYYNKYCLHNCGERRRKWMYQVIKPCTAYAYDTGEEIDLRVGQELSIREDIPLTDVVKNYEFVCGKIARTVWDYRSATTEQLLMVIKDGKTYHSFLPRVQIPNASLMKIESGNMKGCTVWLDTSYVEEKRPQT